MNKDRKNKLSVSLMCADLMNLERDIRRLEKLNVDYLHVDIMDAKFVPNLTFGPDTVNSIRRISHLPLDIHLLMEHPSVIIRSVDIREGDIVTLHHECKDSMLENIAFIKQRHALVGLALNPDTSIEEARKYLPYTDVVLLMLIVPGFAGSTMIHGIMDKVRKTREYLEKKGYDNIRIAVDGSVNHEKAEMMAAMGASVFIGGTAGVFIKGKEIEETVPLFYRAIR